MKQYKFKTIFIGLSISLFIAFSACTGDFSNLNTHPVNPSPDDMTASEKVGTLIPTMLFLMHNTHENDNQHIEQMVANQYGGYMVTTAPWQNTNFGTFNPPAGWVAAPFNTLFTKFYSNYFKVEEATKGSGYIYAWVNIVRVATMLRVADTYGPIPYTKMGGGQLSVEYDDLQTLYHAMLADLDKSIASLTSFWSENAGVKNPIAEYDLIYKGDFSKWIKLANSLKLRMAVRIAAVDTEFAKKTMQEAILAGVIEGNADNAFLPTTDNPYFKASGWGDLAASATLSSYMNGYNDPRRSVYMNTIGNGSFVGVRMGIANINKDYYGNPANFSKPNFTASSPLLVYCAAESYFLKAEAALRGWIDGGESAAKSYYEEGVKISMKQHGVAIENYLSGTSSPKDYSDPRSGKDAPSFKKITVKWDDNSDSDNSKLEKIITQKWLAIYPIGFEAWCDHRRTGFPQMIPAETNSADAGSFGNITNTADRLARRLPYPESEYAGNKANVEKAVATMLGGDDSAATDLWWAKKP